MPSTHKKVIVRKLDRDSASGYMQAANFVFDGKVELLNTAGNVVYVPLQDVKGIYFVRDFDEDENVTRKTFTTRPRSEGLWVRMEFRDTDVIEAMLPNDLTQAGVDGFMVTPPDTRSNTQRIFVPRSALSSMQVLGVIGGPQARRKPAAATAAQVAMFEE